MNSDISTTINSIEFAQKALEIHDTIRVSQLSRLQDLLESTDDVLTCQVIGRVAQENHSELNLKVHGLLSLTCQRCLEPFEFVLNIDTIYSLVPNEEAIPPAEDEDDEKEYLVADANMRVLDLIEDEILLALPLAPKHPIEKCSASDEFNELKKPSPFAVLANFKAASTSGNG
ncbi:MAG: hypothetical protein HOP04_04675 [Methylophilaceae bacterium]|nr:hypothetical protein [Methylophilaceae bacterium]